LVNSRVERKPSLTKSTRPVTLPTTDVTTARREKPETSAPVVLPPVRSIATGSKSGADTGTAAAAAAAAAASAPPAAAAGAAAEAVAAADATAACTSPLPRMTAFHTRNMARGSAEPPSTAARILVRSPSRYEHKKGMVLW